MSNFDVIIVGAGPAGMASSLYLKNAGKNILLIDKNAPGGQMLKTPTICNYLGINNISGAELSLKMFNQIKENGVEFYFNEVKKITKKGSGFIVKTTSKSFTTKKVIIATGRSSNKLNLPMENSISGISYCAVCDGNFYKNEIVGVVGGGKAAYTNALYLSEICKNVYIFVRNKIKCNEDLISKVNKKNNIVVIKKVFITEFMAKNNKITGVILNDGRIIDLKGLFVSIGGHPKLDFIDYFDDYIEVNKNMETSIKGIYACGDVIKKDFYQIATAVNDGIIAGLSIGEEL